MAVGEGHCLCSLHPYRDNRLQRDKAFVDCIHDTHEQWTIRRARAFQELSVHGHHSTPLSTTPPSLDNREPLSPVSRNPPLPISASSSSTAHQSIASPPKNIHQSTPDPTSQTRPHFPTTNTPKPIFTHHGMRTIPRIQRPQTPPPPPLQLPLPLGQRTSTLHPLPDPSRAPAPLAPRGQKRPRATGTRCRGARAQPSGVGAL